ncbi:hypothetical protein [Pararhizobium sp. DWP1-1-3]|uniref:hypothetical protein n=1 Tax=Pararhizobium sp. DWP1-1-3 TaxID=2804652 RepID=UPI003CF44A0E
MSAEARIKAQAVPEDILDAATAVENEIMKTDLSELDTQMIIAGAILAERERCAAVAERYGTFKIDTEHGEGYATAASNIAAAIRAGA